MTKYRVPIVIQFDGAVEVEADSEEDAENTAEHCFFAYIGSTEALYGCDKILDWEVDNSGYVTRAENESIEEVEEL